MDFDLGDIIGGITSLVGIGANTYNNSAALSQTSKQAEAQFAYQQQRDLINDAFRQKQLEASMAASGGAAGATIAAAKIAAAAQNKRTLADLYANVGQEMGQQRKDVLAGFSNLGDALASPYKARAGILR